MMKKVLVIASDDAQSAPGKVFHAYIDLLKKSIDIDVIITNNIKRDSIYSNIHPRVNSLSIKLFNINIFDYSLAKKISSQILDKEYDTVFSMMSSGNFLPLYVGFIIKKRNVDIRWLNYCVDAIPPPKGWGLSVWYRYSLKKMLRNKLKLCNKIYASNSTMLQYQLEVLGKHYQGSHGVLFTLPNIYKFTHLSNSDSSYFNVLYTGGVYQARKVDKLLEAIDCLIMEGINIKLHFVGTNPVSVPIESLKLNNKTIKSVIFHPYTTKLIDYYKLADLLIDIDADIKNDVFISSKFFNYIMVNRPILCITSHNSPVTKLVKDNSIKGVYISKHDSEEINKSLKLLISLKDKKSELVRDNNFLLKPVESLLKDLTI